MYLTYKRGSYKFILKGYEFVDGLFEINVEPEHTEITDKSLATISNSEENFIWHARLGYSSKDMINRTIKFAYGIGIGKYGRIADCET